VIRTSTNWMPCGPVGRLTPSSDSEATLANISLFRRAPLNTNNEIYELDTARAKTPAERLRIVADLIEAQERGERVLCLHNDGGVAFHHARPEDGSVSYRFVTKRRPVLTIPALELFEGPISDLSEHVGSHYFLVDPSIKCGFSEVRWCGDTLDRQWQAAGLCFRTKEAASRVSLHIRAALSKFAGA
jgi:hypothetical protein